MLNDNDISIHIKLSRSCNCFFILSSGPFSSFFRHPIMLLRYADKHIVNIMKVYIEKTNWQLELIQYCKKCCLYTRFLLRSNGFYAISPNNRPYSRCQFLKPSLVFLNRASYGRRWNNDVTSQEREVTMMLRHNLRTDAQICGKSASQVSFCPSWPRRE